ncbi:MAG: heme lyase CcmF/NrfE family subunit [Geminicoccaceae bacterium]|nr:heme lyase CcmF/NrfE family subunit [Geminicoccaceae bacterium]MCX8101353.1 heme lyase CcmF/NrfE family subunit [Geminicoccaceae bacterium]MDW8369434.1 heme lyase CcmF/NrfE family subunit [Geminicoccaceae bacterium]
MIAELGHFALVLAFAVALVQGVLPLFGAARRDATLVAVAPPAALLQLLLISISFGALVHLYIVSDFSVANVAANSHQSKPLVYRISGVWGNHEGSLLLWVWILALFGAAVAAFGKNLPVLFKSRVLAVQALIGVGFLAFMLFTSNPFERLDPAPLEGRGLNPILQDPGLAMHPPMLYLGYVGFSTTFSFAIAGLLEGRIDPSWARWLRPWTLAAWTALTLGIALGSWWAYYELGWGGFWFWDPVENASFMPWLAGTALLHSAIVVEKRDTLKSWTILLAILTFALSLLGTFLVRSGVLTSVHAFASDPARGVFILALLVIAVGGALALYAWRAPSLQGGGMFAPVSREGALLLNNLLLASATATVLLGTLYPLALDVLGGPKISVGPPYFNATFVPLMIPLFLALPIGSVLAWKRAELSGAVQRLWLAAVATVVLSVALLLLRDPPLGLSLIGYGLGIWLILGTLADPLTRAALPGGGLARFWRRLSGLPRASWAMVVAHVGLGVLVIGVTATSTGQSERILAMKPGQTAELAGYEVRFTGVREVRGPNWIAQRGTFEVTRDGAFVAELFSDKRFFLVEQRPTTEAGIHTTLWRDLYFVLGDPAPDGAWTVRLYHNPLVAWIWGGAVLMALGGLLSLSDRRFRVGAPRPARAAAAVPAE